jgi:hypothetical protein
LRLFSSVGKAKQPPALQQHCLEEALERQRLRRIGGTGCERHVIGENGTLSPGQKEHPGEATLALSSPTTVRTKLSTQHRLSM